MGIVGCSILKIGFSSVAAKGIFNGTGTTFVVVGMLCCGVEAGAVSSLFFPNKKNKLEKE